MGYKPELLATAGSLEEVTKIIDAGADAVTIGESTYGMRLPGDFTIEEIREAAKRAHEREAKVYVVVNNIMSNDLLAGLPDYLKQVEQAGTDALVFGDPAVLIAMRQAGVNLPLHWNAEMTSTNYVTANYWGTKGATRVVLARELNLEQVLEIKRKAEVEVQVQVHGITNIYHSKRELVANYRNHLGRKAEGETYSPEKGLFLIEAERRDERYPIYEDRNGTHIMSSEDLCMLENLHELMEGGIDSFKIEGLLKTPDYNEAVVKAYRRVVDAYTADPEHYEFQDEWLEAVERVQPGNRPLSYGFFYKEQVY
ncbi:U32 family peptidase [Paenibacillus sp. CC-CFT747]|nr:U32 family peptidase [Paenibacillus sp. CC-CFT747]